MHELTFTVCSCLMSHVSRLMSHVNAYLLQARVMATIGVTRGLGDHDLKVYNSNIHIKPFLSCCPEVRHAQHVAAIVWRPTRCDILKANLMLYNSISQRTTNSFKSKCPWMFVMCFMSVQAHLKQKSVCISVKLCQFVLFFCFWSDWISPIVFSCSKQVFLHL